MGLLNRQKVQIDRDFTTYDAPFRSANILDYYGPQAVTVVEEEELGFVYVHMQAINGWIRKRSEVFI